MSHNIHIILSPGSTHVHVVVFVPDCFCRAILFVGLLYSMLYCKFGCGLVYGLSVNNRKLKKGPSDQLKKAHCELYMGKKKQILPATQKKDGTNLDWYTGWFCKKKTELDICA
jgi:hypothetical protein